MCLIKFRPDREEEPIIPNRPVKAEGRHLHPIHSVDGEHLKSPQGLETRVQQRNLTTGGQAVVIEQLSSRGSAVQTRQRSYSYKDGLVPTGAKLGDPTGHRNGLLTASHGMSQGPQRKSGSLSHGKTPRQSNASFRTTRERIVVVDDTGRRREYYKRDDSGR
jgi:hypothetical protein